MVSSHSKVQPDCQVTLSTIHSSKGMEFDRVILIDMLDGQLPSAKAIEQRMNGELTLFEEEARLFYVGATRAKNHLEILTSLSLRQRDGYAVPIYPPDYLSSIGDHCQGWTKRCLITLETASIIGIIPQALSFRWTRRKGIWWCILIDMG